MSYHPLHLCTTIIPPDYPSLLFHLPPNPDLKSDVNDEQLVKGLTALTFLLVVLVPNLTRTLKYPEPESCRGSKHVFCG